MATNIYVGNISYQMTEEKLRELFGQYGEVETANIITDRDSGRSKGFAFVEMTDSNSAEAAIQELDGQEIDGRNVRVNVARPRNY